jgi:hypothetical protein
MRKLLVFQHAPSEPLGVLDPMLRRWGFRIRYANFARDPACSWISVATTAWWCSVADERDQADQYPHLPTEIAAIREALRLGVPVLGICLGAQLLAAALGATVRPNKVREIGWYPLQPAPQAGEDRLFRHFDGSQRVFQWHAYTFDLPPGAVHLASSESCEHQAFRLGERAYGCSSTSRPTKRSSGAGSTCRLTGPSWKNTLSSASCMTRMPCGAGAEAQRARVPRVHRAFRVAAAGAALRKPLIAASSAFASACGATLARSGFTRRFEVLIKPAV